MAAQSADLVTANSLSAVAKTLYPPLRMKGLLYRSNPFLGQVKKMTKFGGNNLAIPIQYGSQVGRSTSIAVAQANSAPNLYKQFLLTRKTDYSVGSINREAMLATIGDDNAFVAGLKQEMDGTLYILTRSLATALFHNGGGSIGQISATSNTGTATITLANPDDISNFEVGMQLDVSATDGTSGAIRAVTTQPKIIALDRTNSTITVQGNWSTLTAGAAAGDFIFALNDFNAKVAGLQSWLPVNPPSATLFFGVDRTADTRLGGLRYQGSGAPIEETLQNAAMLAFREGARLDRFFLHPNKLNQLVINLNSRSMYVPSMASASDAPTVGYKGVTIQTAMGPVDCYADPNCPSTQVFGLQMDTWCLYSLGEAPQLIDDDGVKMLRQTSADGFEWRWVYMAQLGCTAPGYNINITL